MKAGVLVRCAGENSPHDSFGDGEGPRVEITDIHISYIYTNVVKPLPVVITQMSFYLI